jgi:hypothetical protein
MTPAAGFPIEGGCDCRAVRYRMLSAPLFVHCCHCRWCQRESGASFALNAMIEADREHDWPAASLARRAALQALIEADVAAGRAG